MHISGVERSDAATVAESSLKGTDPKLSTALSHQGDYVVVKDMEKAFNYAYKACDLKNIYACANLSQMFARGEGTKQNDEKAEKYKKIALAMQEELRPQSQVNFQQWIGKNTGASSGVASHILWTSNQSVGYHCFFVHFISSGH